MSVLVRRVRPAEVDELRRVRLAMLADAPDAFQTRLEDEAAEPLEFWAERARTAARGDRVATFAAVEHGRHLGSATGLRFDPDGPAQLVGMWVEPAARGRGLGRALVEAVCGWAERIGAAEIELDVREHNHAAGALYRRAGFRQVGEPHPAAGASGLVELRMARSLAKRPDGPVIERLRAAPAGDDLVAAAEALSTSDQRSLMLQLARSRTAGLGAAELLAERRGSDLYEPAPVDTRLLHEVEGAALAAAQDFELVTLSPVAPAGVNAVLGRVDQNLTLATVRGNEVLADPTSSLALEAALRRRGGQPAPALGALARVLRIQHFGGGWRRHFGLFALASAGRSQPDDGFALAALRDQLAVYLGMLDRLRQAGHTIDSVTVEVSDSGGLAARCRGCGVDLADLAVEWRAGAGEPEQILADVGVELPRFCEQPPAGWTRLERVAEHVFRPLAEAFPRSRLGFRPGRLHAIGYYTGLLLNVDAALAGNQPASLADGGTLDWTQRLLSDRRERLLASGIGTERVARLLSGPVE